MIKFELRRIGKRSPRPATIIELTISSWYGTLCETITNNNGTVDESFIQQLRDVADELEEQNRLVSEVEND